MIAEDRAPMIKQPEVGATYDAFLNKPEVSDLHHHHHHLSITVTIYHHHHQHLDQHLSQQVCSMFNTRSITSLSINLVTGMMTSDNQVCRVDMSQSAKKIHNFIRGLDSSPGPFKRSSSSSPKHPYHHHHKQNQLHPRPRFLSRCLQRAPTSTPNCFGKTSSP